MQWNPFIFTVKRSYCNTPEPKLWLQFLPSLQLMETNLKSQLLLFRDIFYYDSPSNKLNGAVPLERNDIVLINIVHLMRITGMGRKWPFLSVHLRILRLPMPAKVPNMD